MAHGQLFKKEQELESTESDFIENIDIYPLLCYVLQIECPDRDGSLDRVSVFLRSTTNKSSTDFNVFLIILGSCLLLVFLISALFSF